MAGTETGVLSMALEMFWNDHAKLGAVQSPVSRQNIIKQFSIQQVRYQRRSSAVGEREGCR